MSDRTGFPFQLLGRQPLRHLKRMSLFLSHRAAPRNRRLGPAVEGTGAAGLQCTAEPLICSEPDAPTKINLPQQLMSELRKVSLAKMFLAPDPTVNCELVQERLSRM